MSISFKDNTSTSGPEMGRWQACSTINNGKFWPALGSFLFGGWTDNLVAEAKAKMSLATKVEGQKSLQDSNLASSEGFSAQKTSQLWNSVKVPDSQQAAVDGVKKSTPETSETKRKVSYLTDQINQAANLVERDKTFAPIAKPPFEEQDIKQTQPEEIPPKASWEKLQNSWNSQTNLERSSPKAEEDPQLGSNPFETPETKNNSDNSNPFETLS
jgi:hypothetical protein